MNKNDKEYLAALQGGTVAEIADAVGDMDADALAELRALEEAGGAPRKGVIDAIDKRSAELQPPPKADKAEPKAAAKPWQARDYNGPMTGEQAAWRNANLKPVDEVVTK